MPMQKGGLVRDLSILFFPFFTPVFAASAAAAHPLSPSS
jgi:hypothetical protein